MGRSVLWLSLAFLLASLAPARALTVSYDWVRTPTNEDMMRAYPPAAREQRVEGYASLNCVIAKTGRLKECRIEAEGPEGWGFGEAAKSVAQSFVLRLPRGATLFTQPSLCRLERGFCLPGETVRVPLRFHYQGLR